MAGCLGRSSISERAVVPLEDVPTRRPSDRLWNVPTDLGLYRRSDHGAEQLLEGTLSGGVPMDGIPSIDDPVFGRLTADLIGPRAIPAGEPVFGLIHNGEARVYPQRILVWHEIVNDVVGDEPVAVTYCPLTGTAQCFRRGESSFGVSGILVNSNLVMFDRDTESLWPQITGRAIYGDRTDEHLTEIQMVWTSAERWLECYPDSRILLSDTDYARSYGIDPYGEYNPRSGYYASDEVMFELLHDDERLHPKRIVFGAQWDDTTVAVEKRHLRAEAMIDVSGGDEGAVAVYDPWLDTGYFVLNPNGHALAYEDGHLLVDGETADVTTHGLRRVMTLESLWFAWAAFHPSTTIAVPKSG